MNESKRQQFLAGAVSVVSLLTIVVVAFMPLAAAEPAGYNRLSFCGRRRRRQLQRHGASIRCAGRRDSAAARTREEQARGELFDQQLRILKFSSQAAKHAKPVAQERLDRLEREAALSTARVETGYNDNDYYLSVSVLVPTAAVSPFGSRPPHGGRPGMRPPIEPPPQHVMLP